MFVRKLSSAYSFLFTVPGQRFLACSTRTFSIFYTEAIIKLKTVAVILETFSHYQSECYRHQLECMVMFSLPGFMNLVFSNPSCERSFPSAPKH